MMWERRCNCRNTIRFEADRFQVCGAYKQTDDVALYVDGKRKEGGHLDASQWVVCEVGMARIQDLLGR